MAAELVGNVPSDATGWDWLVGRKIAGNFRTASPYSYIYWSKSTSVNTAMKNLPTANAPAGLPTDPGVNTCCFGPSQDGTGGKTFPPGVNVEPDAEETCIDVLGEVPLATDPNLGESWCE